METRKIIIVDSSANKKVVVDTDATNFGELKRAAAAAGISYEGKDWLEGITKTTPVSDDSLLPVNVNYKGTITNNLVYMITNTNKKIRSGMDRKELYAKIKGLSLEDIVKKTYGKNYTQVSSVELAKVVEGASPKKASKVVEKPASVKNYYKEAVNALALLFANLPKEVLQDISEASKKLPSVLAEEVTFSDKELQDLFK